jgi:hypothetical protein
MLPAGDQDKVELEHNQFHLILVTILLIVPIQTVVFWVQLMPILYGFNNINSQLDEKIIIFLIISISSTCFG